MRLERGTHRAEVCAGPEALAEAAANRIVHSAREALAARGRFTIALSGGETARAIYEALASPSRRDAVDWSRAEVYWGDERCVPPDHPRSNYGMARDSLLTSVAVPETQVHRMQGEDDPTAGALAYERLLRERFGPGSGLPTGAVFDIDHLGMGQDGHTASLFPGLDAVDERERWVVTTRDESNDEWRMTLTPPALSASRLVLITVAGAAKAGPLVAALEGEGTTRELPVRAIEPSHGEVLWLIDEAAASLLGRSRGTA